MHLTDGLCLTLSQVALKVERAKGLHTEPKTLRILRVWAYNGLQCWVNLGQRPELQSFKV